MISQKTASKLLEILETMLDNTHIRFVGDRGPEGEGWQSDELKTIFENAEQIVKKANEETMNENKLAALVAQLNRYRVQSSVDWEIDQQGGWVRFDELERLLTAEARCVCMVEDSLVQEWVSKARAVAKSKGLLTAEEKENK